MKTKTWKIGEYAKGGIITVEIHGKTILIIGKDWDYSTGSRRSSNQSNAKEWTRREIKADESNRSDVRWKIDLFLNDLTSSYYADQILKWIESKVKLGETFPWEQ